MRTQSRIVLTVVSALALGLLVPTYLSLSGLAQEPRPQDARGDAISQEGGSVSLGTGFAYQGRLQDSGGNPVSDTCDLAFSLWEAASGGDQVGADCTAVGVQFADGYFTAIVNAGYEFGANAFLGDARWLQIAVRCSGDADFATLSPRQAITPAPYALTLRPGSAMVGQVTGDASMLWVGNQATSGYASALYGESASPSARAVRGVATAGSGTTYGVYGQADSTGGTGVFGHAGAGSGTTSGVSGLSNSSNGRGVYGLAPAVGGENYGVYGQSNSSSGRGVYGYVLAGSGESYGVYGQSNSNGGRGVYGYVPATSGETVAVYGRARSASGTGVYGNADAASGTTYGVRGSTNSAGGYGGYFANTAGGTALYADGDAAQSLAGDGLVKAGAYVSCGLSTVVDVQRYFNTVNGWLAASNIGSGQCRLDFNFSLADRFWIASPLGSTPRIVQCNLGPNDDQLDCQIYLPTGAVDRGSFMVIVY